MGLAAGLRSVGNGWLPVDGARWHGVCVGGAAGGGGVLLLDPGAAGARSYKISYKHGKTAHMGILSFIVPSRDVHSLFWVP